VTLIYLSTGLGGAIGCIFAGVMTEYHHPKWCFFYYSFVGLIVTVFACLLTKDSELDIVHDGVIQESDISTSQEDYVSE
jgi:MFS-type transporter involved in bile tolerance (Atg22 family)